MLNQTSVTEITSEEILQQMIRETFEVPKIEKPPSDENFPGAGFSQQIERDLETKEFISSETGKYTNCPTSNNPSRSLQNYL